MKNTSEFEKELLFVDNKEINTLTRMLILNFPPKFWTAPASSTGKYHPESSLVKGGLVIHTKQVFWIAHSILSTGQYKANPDIVLSACLLHDGWKYDGSGIHTLRYHAIKAVQRILEIVESSRFFLDAPPPSWFQRILDCIQAHNGTFTNEWAGQLNVEQKIVHVSDYLASRRFLNYKEI